MADLEVAALRERGVEVHTHFRRSDEMLFSRRVTLEAVAAQARPAFTLRSLRRQIRRIDPDVIHLHNPFPLIPPGIVTVAHRLGIPVVQSLHNLRHSSEGPRRPYGQSLSHALLSSASLALNRRRFVSTDGFIVPSEWLRSVLARSGLPAERLSVVPNGVPDPGPPAEPGEDLLFVGRLEEEKGLPALLEAWRAVGRGDGRSLVVAGAGPLEASVVEAARTMPNLRFAGRLSPEEVQREMARSIAVVVPSVVPESFGLAAVEAFAAGRPVIASNAGALGEIVDESVGWPTRSDGELAQALSRIDPAEARERGAAARRRYLDRFTLDRATDGVIGTFGSLIAARSSS